MNVFLGTVKLQVSDLQHLHVFVFFRTVPKNTLRNKILTVRDSFRHAGGSRLYDEVTIKIRGGMKDERERKVQL